MRFGYADWEESTTEELERAQEARLKQIGNRLRLGAGQRVLVIGCWWGSLSQSLATTHSLKVTTLTYGLKSEEAIRSMCTNLPIEIRTMDDGDFTKVFKRDEKFDGIVAVDTTKTSSRMSTPKVSGRREVAFGNKRRSRLSIPIR